MGLFGVRVSPASVAMEGDARMYNQRVLDLTGGRVYARSSGGSGL